MWAYLCRCGNQWMSTATAIIQIKKPTERCDKCNKWVKASHWVDRE